MRRSVICAARTALLVLVGGCSFGDKATVPDVVGEEEGSARGLLIGQGFVAEVVEQEIADVPAGQVMSSDPEPGSELAEGETVTLRVAVSPEFTLAGTFTLIDSGIRGSDDNCFGSGGYDDIQAGVSVTVRDGGGSLLATGRLGPGVRQELVTCTFEFEVPSLPMSDFYSVEVGRRGELSYSFDELDSMGWRVAFSLS